MGFESLASIGKGIFDAVSHMGDFQYNRHAAEINNLVNYKIATQTNRTNYELAHEQNDWNERMWNENNAYNSPEQQVQRFKAAGLSDAAAAQAAQGFQSSAPTSADLANQQIPPEFKPYFGDVFKLPDILGMFNMFYQLKKDKAETEIVENKAKQSDIETEHYNDFFLTNLDVKKSELNLKRQEYEQLAKSFPYSLRSLRYKAKADEQLPALRDIQVKRENAEYEQVAENVKLARQQFSWLEDSHKVQLHQMQEEINNLITSRQNMLKQGKVLDEQASNLQKEGKILNEKEYQEKIVSVLHKYGMPESQAEKVGVLMAEGKLNGYRLETALKGVQEYIKEGHKWFGADAITRDFLYNFWDRGSSKRTNLSSAGLLNQVGQDFSTLLKFGF